MNFQEAAQARAEAFSAIRTERASRPGQRRSVSEATGKSMLWTPAIRIQGMEFRAFGTEGTDAHVVFEGYASVTDTPYQMYDAFGPYMETMQAGAFATSLNRVDLDVPLVLGHNDMQRIARTTNGTLTLSEDDTGLHVLAKLDPAEQDTAYILGKLRSGLIDEMSFRFMITAGEWSPDWTEYHVSEVDFHRGDVSIVGYGANPATKGSGIVAPDAAGALSAAKPEPPKPEPAKVRFQDWEFNKIPLA